jgi:Protein of unknown function (DUF4230)
VGKSSMSTSADSGRSRGGGSLLVTGVILGALVVFAIGLGGFLLSNPFKKQTVDRTAPVVLTSLEDLSEYRAATAKLEVLVDLENDTPWVPAAISGDRTFFVGVGSVDASVDFSGLKGDNIEVSPDRTKVTVHLPEPTFTEARVDPDDSHVAARSRGLLDRIGGVFTDSPTNDAKLFSLAEEKMTKAAEDSGLRDLAKANTEKMLRGLLGGLGFTEVNVVFDKNPN